MGRKKSNRNQKQRVRKTPTCEHHKSTVEKTNSVHLEKTTVIHRTRKCKSCGVRFKTREEQLD